jgi:hypothetical protein
MSALEDINWKLKEAAYLAPKREYDCELGGATLTNKLNEPDGAKPTPLIMAHGKRAKRNPYASTDREIGWQNEPDLTMPSLNPFTTARNLSSKRQSDIAAALELDIVDVIRLEQGIVTQIPKAIAQYYTRELKMPTGWEAGYRMFQQSLRRSAPRPIYGVWRTPPGEFNFRRWRTYNWPTLSQMGWCKAFCVHPSSLYAVEMNTKQPLPSDILTALIEANIMSEEQARHFAFKIRQSNGVGGTINGPST